MPQDWFESNSKPCLRFVRCSQLSTIAQLSDSAQANLITF